MLIAAAVILGLLVIAEVALRAYGVGRPVVRLWHHTIEYLQKPSCAYRIRFNRIAYNRWSMRGEDFPREKPPGRRRIIILGDSVVDGGTHVDQAEHVSARLSGLLGGAEVGSAGAASWGPPNQLAYLREYGTFDADAFIIVASSHDAGDVPRSLPPPERTGQEIERRSWLALGALAGRMMARSLADATSPQPAGDPSAAMDDCRELLRTTVAAAPTLVVLHPEASERFGGASTERLVALEQAAIEAGAGVLHLDLQREDYRDNIHVNPSAHRTLAELIAGWITK